MYSITTITSDTMIAMITPLIAEYEYMIIDNRIMERVYSFLYLPMDVGFKF